jgi:Putative phage metallopeptidase
MRTTKKAPAKKAKKVAYRFIDPKSPEGQPLYALLYELVDAHHDDLSKADTKIALAWNLSWSPDVDGRMTLGKCKRVADLEREIADLDAYDFVIILHQEFWTDELVTDLQRRALLDHELMHAAVKLDERGEPMVDERGRTVYRTRKHDLEEFAAIADRYGCWKRDLVQFAEALDRARRGARDRWTGYSTLRAELQVVGVDVALDAVLEWNETERRDALTWARLRAQFPDQQPAMPSCVANAIPVQTHA